MENYVCSIGLFLLQNLEVPSVAQNHATLLLDAALDRCSWDLARELVRFLRTIGDTFYLFLNIGSRPYSEVKGTITNHASCHYYND